MFKQTQRSFTGGQLDRELMGRTDLAKYFEGACKLENFLVRRQGNIAKRRGTELVADLDNLFGDGSYIESMRAIPFATTSTEIGYTILFAESSTHMVRCFVCTKEGILVKVTTTPTGGGDATVSYAFMRNAYNADETTTDATISYEPYSIEVPYLGSDFQQIGHFQSGDTLFLAHKNYPFATLTHPDDYVWSYSVIDFEQMGAEELPPTPVIESVTPSSEFDDSEGSPRTIEYRVTAVKNGLESRPSPSYVVTYNTPWPENGTMTVNIVPQSDPPDYYNIYKRQDATWGLVGSTTLAQTAVSAFPTASGLTNDFKTSWFKLFPNSSATRTSDTAANTAATRLVSTRAKDNFNNGGQCYIAGGMSGDTPGNGTFTLDYGSGCSIDEFYLGIGSAIYFGSYGYQTRDDPQTYDVKAWIYFLKSYTASVKATVVFDNNDTQEINSVNHSQTSKTSTDVAGLTGRTDTISEKITKKIREFCQDQLQYLKFTIYDRTVAEENKKKVKQIIFRGFTDTTQQTVATGKIDGNSASAPGVVYPNEQHPAAELSVTGNPFVVHGFYAVLHGGTTSTTFVDQYIEPDASATPPNVEPHFEAPGLYPSCVCMYDQRLALASTLSQPFTYWLSAIGDLYNFNTHDSIREDDALEATLPATKHPNINHMVLNRDLILFCDNGEWVVQPVSGNTLTYKTLSVKMQSQIGCSKNLVPIVVGNDIIFINATNETLHATRYNYASDGYEDMDLTVLAQNLFRSNPIVSIAYKKDPDSTILCATKDGTIAALVYMREHEVVAWSHLTLGGDMKAISCSADESVTDGTTNVFIVASSDNGEYTGYSLLRVKEDSPFTDVASAVSMDRMETVEIGLGTPATTVPDGQKAVRLLDGAIFNAGATLESGATYIVGYPFTSELVTIRPEPSPQETIQFERKNAKSVEVRTLNGSSYELKAFKAPDAIPFTPVGAEPMVDEDGLITLDASDHTKTIQGINSGDGRIRLRHTGVWPLSILQLSVNYEIQPLSGAAG